MNFKKSLFFLASILLLSPLTASCSSSDSGDYIKLRILNSEDYIGEGEIEISLKEGEEAETFENVIAAFEAYEKKVNNKNVKVIYDTFDTNETMLSSLKTGKSTYDLICPSDYTIQKMMANGMLEPFDSGSTPNYDEYASRYLLSQMDYISSTIGDGSEIAYPISKYAKGYMWGTLGVLYNPSKINKEKGIDEDTVKFDMADWSSLWDNKYQRMMSIKDSMRDTYSVGIMKLFDEELKKVISESGYYDENYEPKDGIDFISIVKNITNDQIFKGMDGIFNRCDQETVKQVEDILLDLKSNVFGFEVDSGKDDMVKGLIGMNLAWSGDAVYSMDRGENEAGQTIYYSIPKTGGNIWFDGWVMPKSDSLHKEEAQEFVDFLSRPDISSANMDYIGYTSFIAGEEVFGLIREWYDPRSYQMYVYHDASNDPGCTWEDSDFVYDENGEKVIKDGTGVHEDGDDYGSFDMTGSTYDKPVVNGTPMSWEDYINLYNAQDGLSEDDELSWDTVNLTYVFDGTISTDGYDLSSTIPDTNPFYFYTDQTETIVSPYGTNEEVKVGRQFFAQYPPEDLIPKLAAMKDYGTNNKYVLTMWENVKGNNLPWWGVVVFGIIVAIVLFFAISAFVTKMKFRKLKVERRKQVRVK